MSHFNRKKRRKDLVLLFISGIFLGTLGLLNILGISRFVDLSFYIGAIKVPMVVAVGVLPYPITFLCTDLVSELYGRTKANQLVLVGFIVNLWVMFILWLGGVLPGVGNGGSTLSGLQLDAAGRLPLYFEVQQLAFGAVFASMLAYTASQFCDVYLFHFWKRWTRGRHLWLRNNGSTVVSQLIDTITVILVTYYVNALPLVEDLPILTQLGQFILSAYLFKLMTAVLDTIPLYVLVKYLSRYFNKP